MIRVSILGATGYSGAELIKILLNHPNARLQSLTSESSPGKPIAAIHPQFRDRLTQTFVPMDVKKIAKESDVVFLCFPAGVGIAPATAFLKSKVKVIDLSADFRLPTAKMYEAYYHGKHGSPQLLKDAVYGLPELFRDKIAGASLVANPGCYATAATLSAAPLLRPAIIDPHSVIVDAKSGVSGAGKKVTSSYMYVEVNENLHAYNVAVHRHQPEIETVLKKASSVDVKLTFTPHLVPMSRGILSVLYATLKKPMKTGALLEMYRSFYANEPFVRILPEGELPQTRNVTNTNYCDIGITQDSRLRRVIVVSAIDNLVKGASGQAVQNMNLIFNRPETEGLL